MKPNSLGTWAYSTGADRSIASGRDDGVEVLIAVLLISMSGLLPGAAVAQQLGGTSSQSRVGATVSTSPATIEAPAPSASPVTAPAEVTRDWGQSAAATVRRLERDTYEQPSLPYQESTSSPSHPVAVDWCLHWGSDCGQPAADKFCQWIKRSTEWRAAEFEKRPDVRKSFVMGTRDVCAWAPTQRCDGFKRILCEKAAPP